MHTILRTLLLIIITSQVTFSQTGQQVYSLVRVDLSEKSMEDFLQLGIEIDHGEYRSGKYLENVFSADDLRRIQEAGFRTKVTIPDIREALLTPMVEGRTADCPEFSDNRVRTYSIPENFSVGSMAGYFTYQEMLEHLDSMHQAYPELITRRSPIDTILTHEGNQLYWLRISDHAATDEPEPEILYTALHHAREPGSLSQLIFFMWYLLENYGEEPAVTYLLDNTELYFIPCVNPDGYLYNEATDPQGGGLWRKNRRDNGDDTYGVDLNRNYGFEWGFNDFGSSPEPGSEVYRGPAPFSEPETRALARFCEQHAFEYALNYHTFGDLLIYPWGYLDRPSEDSLEFNSASRAMNRQNRYLAGTATETVGYQVNGTSDDWMYGETDTKPAALSMTPEVGTGGFWPPRGEILGMCRATLWQNLLTGLLVHQVGLATDLSPRRVREQNGQLHFRIERHGRKDGLLTVGLKGLSPNILRTGNAKSFSLDPLASAIDSIAFELSPDVLPGEELVFELSVDNGPYTFRDTLVKEYRGDIVPAFADDCSDLENWYVSQNGEWGLSYTDYFSPGSSITDSPDGDYANRTETRISLEQPLDLSDALEAKLHFAAKWDIEANYDYAQVMASVNGIIFAPLCGRYTEDGTSRQDEDRPVYDGNQPSWVEEEIDLSDYLGQPQVFIRFRLVSDNFTTGDGFYFDDLELIKKTDTGTATKSHPSLSDRLNLHPNPATNALTIGLSDLSGEDFPASLSVTNSLGSPVQQLEVARGTREITLDTRDLSGGTYWILLRSGEKILARKAFFIQR